MQSVIISGGNELQISFVSVGEFHLKYEIGFTVVVYWFAMYARKHIYKFVTNATVLRGICVNTKNNIGTMKMYVVSISNQFGKNCLSVKCLFV